MPHSKKAPASPSNYFKINTKTGKWSLVKEKISLADTISALHRRLETGAQKGNLAVKELIAHEQHLKLLSDRVISHIDAKKHIPVIGAVTKALKKAWMRKKFRAAAHAIQQSKNDHTEKFIHTILHNGDFYYPEDTRTLSQLQAKQKHRFLSTLASWAKSHKQAPTRIPPFSSFLDPHNSHGFVILFATHPNLRLYASQTQHTTVLDCEIDSLHCTVKEKNGKYVCLLRHHIFGTKTIPFDNNFLSALHSNLFKLEQGSLEALQEGWAKWAA